ncbi:MAG: DUF3842 family protein [Peptococcaceae bacterium]|nr:DUF3842 family protein [Peptococcaceae bacterium]
MRIAVIDGQGGGIGRLIIEKLSEKLYRPYPKEVEIIALGTNALATSVMLKAGANEGASGENAVIHNAPRVDLIMGSVAILFAHSMLGELTPAMAEAVAKSPARKIVLPLNRSNVDIVGLVGEPLPHLVDEMVNMARITLLEELRKKAAGKTV